MDKARTFFYVCAGLLMLAASYQLGAREAKADKLTSPIVQITHDGADETKQRKTFIAVTASGDVYTASGPAGPWSLASNVFSTATPEERTRKEK